MAAIDLTSDGSDDDETWGILASTSPRRGRTRKRSAALTQFQCEADSNDEETMEMVFDENSNGKKAAIQVKGKRLKKNIKASVICDTEDESDEDMSPLPLRQRLGLCDTNEEIETDAEDDTKKKHGTSRSSLPSPSSNVSNSANDISPKAVAAFLRARQAGVRAREFDLDRIPMGTETIPTGRTIKKMTGWSGLWPALREFMQNTIDHLSLLDSTTGRRHAALVLDVTHEAETTAYNFHCGNEVICSIHAMGADELVIHQAYTFPLPPRALDTGVPDTTKGNATAGGFGDGFKTAAVALLALPKKDFRALTWTFHCGGSSGAKNNHQGERIVWNFVGRRRERVGTFAACNVLEVEIKRTAHATTPSAASTTRKNWMEQRICVKGIGKAFLLEAVPRLQVFWDTPVQGVLSIGAMKTAAGGDYLADAKTHPFIRNGRSDGQRRPEPGVYVHGIFVRSPKIENTIMSFFGKRLDVIGRDRNDVDDDELVEATATVLRRCGDLATLRDLLQPLRGKKQVALSSSSPSWLLRSPRFMNRILEAYRDFFIHDVFGIPPGAIFVSSRTTNSKDPFTSWAAAFLETRGAPLVPLEPGSNRQLFMEVNETELVERCVTYLLEDDRERAAERKKKSRMVGKRSDESTALDLQSAAKKLLGFMGHKSAVKIICSPAVSVAFVHEGRRLFAPEAELSREMLVKLLNVAQSQLDLGASSSEAFTALIQALFETVTTGGRLSLSDVDAVIDRAKCIRKDNAAFLYNKSTTAEHRNRSSNKPMSVNSTHSDGGDSAGGSSSRGVRADEIDLTLESSESDSRRDGEEATGGRSAENDRAKDLLKQIRRANRAGGGEDRPIIPESAFGSDDAGSETCLRPSSALQRIVTSGPHLGEGELFCDAKTAAALSSLSSSSSSSASSAWSPRTCRRLRALRVLLRRATALVEAAIPSAKVLLPRIKDGFDQSNLTYEGFCDGNIIIVNLSTYMSKLRTDPPLSFFEGGNEGSFKFPRGLLHEMVVTVTHELAHLLESGGGHGPSWRDTHMSLLQEIYCDLVSYGGQLPGAGWAIGGRCVSCG